MAVGRELSHERRQGSAARHTDNNVGVATKHTLCCKAARQGASVPAGLALLDKCERAQRQPSGASESPSLA